MKTYWFKSEDSGEEFFVEAENEATATTIVTELFYGEELTCFGEISYELAEAMGYDTY